MPSLHTWTTIINLFDSRDLRRDRRRLRLNHRERMKFGKYFWIIYMRSPFNIPKVFSRGATWVRGVGRLILSHMIMNNKSHTRDLHFVWGEHIEHCMLGSARVFSCLLSFPQTFFIHRRMSQRGKFSSICRFWIRKLYWLHQKRKKLFPIATKKKNER